MARCRVVFAELDADPPLYPWRQAPPHLLTRSQLKTAGLRPGRRPAGMLAWASRRGGQLAAIARALAARRRCPACGRDPGYVPSARLGCCNDCAVAA